jgi:hypothetical protein
LHNLVDRAKEGQIVELADDTPLVPKLDAAKT